MPSYDSVATNAVYARTLPSTAVWNEMAGRQMAQNIDDQLFRSLGVDAGWREQERARIAAAKVEARITGPVNSATPFCPELEL